MIRLLSLLLSLDASAGGGPANLMVMFNADDPDAQAVAEHYMETRDVPQANGCEVFGISPAANSIGLDDYELHILTSLDDCLETHPQSEEIDILLLIRGLPYRVDLPSGFSTSLEAMLQIFHTASPETGELLMGQAHSSSGETYTGSIESPLHVGHSSTDLYELSNPYMAHYSTAVTIASDSEQPRSIRRRYSYRTMSWDFEDNFFVVSRLDGFSYSDAWDLVDRGSDADGLFPEAPILCMAAADSARGARDPECHYTVQLLDAAGIPATWKDTHEPTLTGETLAGMMTGTTSLADAINGNDWVPGAFIANLTSYGAVPSNFRCSPEGLCPESESQTSIARFVNGGATFAHGTANEPLNNTFPGAGMFLLATMGYGMIESAVLTQRYLYWQNIYLGDPLSSPWAERPIVSINPDVPENRSVTMTAEHVDGIAGIRLYADGVRIDRNLSLDESVGARAGDTVDLLAVAIAENVPTQREGWPEPEQQPRADVQGWQRLSIVVGDPILDDEDSGLSDEPYNWTAPASDGDKETGGCAAHPTSIHLWWVGLLLILGYRESERQAEHAQQEHKEGRSAPLSGAT